MPHYAYRATSPDGGIAKGILMAANENELAGNLALSGMELISARKQTDGGNLHLSLFKPSARALALSFAKIRDLLRSGTDIPQSLHDTAKTTSNAVLRQTLRHIGTSIQNGSSVSEAFSQHAHIYPPLIIAVLTASESSGSLSNAADTLSGFLTSQAQTADKIRKAMTYPLFLITIAGGATLFMMSTVIPQIVYFLHELDGHLPWTTRLLISLTSAVAEYGPTIFFILLVLSLGMLFVRLTSPPFAFYLDKISAQLPLYGSLTKKISMARYASAYSILSKSGCSTPDCLSLSSAMVGNRFWKHSLDEAKRNVIQGSSLSKALSSFFPPHAVGLLAIGEFTNSIERTFEEIGQTYHREAGSSIDSAIAALEPSITLLIGLLLAWTVLSMIGPLYASLSLLGGRM